MNAIGISIGTTVNAQEKIVDKIVAVIGDKIVLASDVEIQHQQALAQGMFGDDVKCQILDQLLLEKMFQTHAQIDSLTVGEEEIEVELDGRVRYFLSMFGGDEAKMEEFYGKTVLEIKDEFRSDIEDQILARKMQNEILANITVTPSEVRNFFNTIPKDSIPYFNAEVELAQLVLKPKVPKSQKDATKQKLLEIKQRIIDGEEFAAMAENYSEDFGSAANGGDLGWVERGQFVPEFEGAAFKLKAGEFSDIVETQFGFHLIQMLERRGEKIHTRHILIKPEVTDADLEATQKRLDSIRNVILSDTLTFKEAVEKYSEDEETKNTGGLLFNQNNNSSVFEIDELDPTLYFAIDTLKEGDTSQALKFEMRDGSPAYRLMHIYTRTSPHLANIEDDYNKIVSVVEMQKQQEAMLKWLDRRIPTTYIKIDPNYQNCEIIGKWLSKERKL